MKDIMRLCGRCHHEHAWGIIRKSEDNVNLYGARMCVALVENALSQQYPCNCADFVADGGTELMVGLPPEELGKLWQETSFLNAQTPMASRIAIRQIMSLEPGPERDREFMGLMLSQVMDTRALLSNDENKFAHMVAHVDEIVESMRAVSQLKEQMESVNRRIDRTNERFDRLEVMLTAIANTVGVPLTPPPDFEVRDEMFTRANTTMQDEAVVVDGIPADDDLP